MFTKIGYTDGSIAKMISKEDFDTNLASPEILEKLNKFATAVRTIAPKSDDFLYFTIIFMKAAESATIDEFGNLKKVGKENAWGYFDEKWKWHGNVKAHKNVNGDLFPESQLKLAFRNWIGKPLCVDHRSDSVDGVRGIILDTHYDEKLKQIVGLCALDKVNYPDLARKVQTGVVRYGSMGTAVSTSICYDCGKNASNASEYCDCVLQKRSWGEINVGLKPIEYSLVVQPAEPAAILLRCIASVNAHKSELNSFGISVDSIEQSKIPGLDLILNKVCENDSCSLEQRKKVITSYINYNGLNKTASVKKAEYNKELLTDLARFEDVFGVKYNEDPELYSNFFGESLKQIDVVNDKSLSEKNKEMVNSNQLGETFTSGNNSYNSETIINKDDEGRPNYTGTGSSGLVSSPSEPVLDSFKGDGVGLDAYTASNKNKNIKLSNVILGGIMNEARLRHRAALRRRLAYHQGGSESAVEPNTFKDEGALNEKIREKEDKQMLQTKSMGGDDGAFPGDKEMKEKLLRAEEVLTGKKAYYQGGSGADLEPSTYKSENYKKYWDMDKHMHQTKSMGGDTGVFPGDEKTKEHLKRAQYNGPALSTKIIVKKALDGSINKGLSAFEVYAGNKLVIAATAKDIFGSKVDERWNQFVSDSYSKSVLAHIRETGIPFTAKKLIVNAQVAPEAAPAEVPAAMPPAPEAAPMDMGSEMPSMDAPMDLSSEGEPKAVVEDALIKMEDTIEEIREAITDLGGSEDVDVNINVGGEGSDVNLPEDKLALSKDILAKLKVVYATANDHADELAKIAEIISKKANLPAEQSKLLASLTREALTESAAVQGESKTLIRFAKTIAKTLVKVSEYKEPVAVTPKPVAKAPVKTASSKIDTSDELVSKALELRKSRREGLLKKAKLAIAQEAEKVTDKAENKADDMKADKKEEVEDKKENLASDGVGMMENAGMAGVTKDSGTDVATSKPTGTDKPAGHAGNMEVKFTGNVSTPGQEVANSTPSSVTAKLTETFTKKKAQEESENYKIKLRRAYNVAMEMQRKGMISQTHPALDRAVDEMMNFDDKAFESYKRVVANTKGNVKVASDLALEVGLQNNEDEIVATASKKVDISDLNSVLNSQWKKK